jgi:hypothetical protein
MMKDVFFLSKTMKEIVVFWPYYRKSKESNRYLFNTNLAVLLLAYSRKYDNEINYLELFHMMNQSD